MATGRQFEVSVEGEAGAGWEQEVEVEVEADEEIDGVDAASALTTGSYFIFILLAFPFRETNSVPSSCSGEQ